MVPCLTQRTSFRGVLVRRFAWVGNVTVDPWGCNVRVAPHSGHSTLAMAVRAIWSGISAIAPAMVSFLGGWAKNPYKALT